MATPHTSELDLDIERGVALVTLNRPHAMNALSIQMRADLIELATKLDRDADVGAVVFIGAGGKAFCAGADLNERGQKSAQELYDERRYFRSRWINFISSMVKPTIAAINGYCLGGGLELALQCDIRIASEQATFGLPEVTLGFLPGAGATQRLPRAIGLQKAKELILTGRRFGAREAEELGLVARTVPHETLLAGATELARTIAANPRLSVIQAKLALNASQETFVSGGLQFENEAWLSCLLSDAWKGKLERFAGRKDA
ncbi:MAG: enoyl-CoA hydratase [Betaproteobacteria bacterium]|jgi:enoyl-CoA hydratase/carnithine racemase|nr:enoyl-CoA hydratase [Betaproteobacteria bacterium]